MDKLTREEILHVAELARIKLTEEEIEKYRVQLKQLLNDVEKINDVKGYDDEILIACWEENIPENLAEYYINKMNQSIQQAYQDAYIQDMKNRGYRFKTKHTIKDYLKMIATIAIMIIIVILVFQIPFVKKYFISVYQDNYFVKIIVDIFVNTFKQMFKM